MRFVGPLAGFGIAMWVLATGCATGTLAGGDDDTDAASPTTDGSPSKDSSAKDSSTSGGDSSSAKDSTAQDTGTGNCGGTCGSETCCNNTCVDTTSDPNNCNACGFACTGGNSCCSSSCTDTMGSDNANCGGCGVPCTGTCTNGSCQVQTGCTIDISTCSHSPCVSGVALTDGCDDNDEAIVSFVCELLQPSCCTTKWGPACVLYAEELEENSCSGC